jgi:hypothetical protein
MGRSRPQVSAGGSARSPMQARAQRPTNGHTRWCWARPDLFAALIRPDGVLAWAATPLASPDTTCLKTALHTWFGPPRRRADDAA